jgi:ribosomal protein S6--L-glutamate ligase
MKIAFFLTRHRDPSASPIMPEVVRLLERAGASVDVVDPAEALIELTTITPEHDLYVLKTRTDLSLSIAGALHAAGAAILNPYPVAAACRDKIVASRLLRTAGVPLPGAYAAATPGRLAPLLERHPLVVKPYRGSQGRGVRVVRSAAELAAAVDDGAPVFAQRYHEPRGRDRKIYRIGGRIFGVKRVWPARTPTQKQGEEFDVDAELEQIALRLGAALGITLYGFDVIATDDGPLVVDFSPFPGFKGVPDASTLLAEYIHRAAERVVEGEAVLGDHALDPAPA